MSIHGNEINLILKIEEKDINSDIYYLIKDGIKFSNKEKAEEYESYIKYYNKLLNESKIEIFINDKNI